MIRTIWKEERYPDFGIAKEGTNCSGIAADIPDELIERWAKADAEYDSVQKELEVLYKQGASP